jgi:hypothetical protein
VCQIYFHGLREHLAARLAADEHDEQVRESIASL